MIKEMTRNIIGQDGGGYQEICGRCQEHQQKLNWIGQKRKSSTPSTSDCNVPSKRISVDLIGPLPESSDMMNNGRVDYLTKMKVLIQIFLKTWALNNSAAPNAVSLMVVGINTSFFVR